MEHVQYTPEFFLRFAIVGISIISVMQTILLYRARKRNEEMAATNALLSDALGRSSAVLGKIVCNDFHKSLPDYSDLPKSSDWHLRQQLAHASVLQSFAESHLSAKNKTGSN